jgi:hypothetical protein
MTSADIRDVLSLPNTGPSHGQQPKKKKPKSGIDPALKNATGITRELYHLLGQELPHRIYQARQIQG